MSYGSENLIIKQKLEDAIEYSYCVFRHFPKSERFTLVADLKRSQMKMLQLVTRANKSRDKIPMGEVKTFEQQYSGAKAIVASNPVHEHALFVQDLLTVRIGRTPTTEELMTFANRIILNYDTAKAYTVNIIGTQQYLENLVKACTTAEEVEAVPEWVG